MNELMLLLRKVLPTMAIRSVVPLRVMPLFVHSRNVQPVTATDDDPYRTTDSSQSLNVQSLILICVPSAMTMPWSQVAKLHPSTTDGSDLTEPAPSCSVIARWRFVPP